jgi:hypothetical protein
MFILHLAPNRKKYFRPSLVISFGNLEKKWISYLPTRHYEKIMRTVIILSICTFELYYLVVCYSRLIQIAVLSTYIHIHTHTDTTHTLENSTETKNGQSCEVSWNSTSTRTGATVARYAAHTRVWSTRKNGVDGLSLFSAAWCVSPHWIFTARIATFSHFCEKPHVRQLFSYVSHTSICSLKLIYQKYSM